MDIRKNNLFIRIKAVFNPAAVRNNQRLIIFMVCLVIATILWFLNALSKNYTTQIAYPVKYINLPRNKFIINDPPENLQLRVNAHGFTLLRYKLQLAFYPVELNIAEIMEENRMPAGGYVTLRPGDIMEKISGQISSDLNILDVRPAMLSLVFDSLESRMIPVKQNLEIHYMSRFDQAGRVEISPSVVEITGPRAVIMHMDTVFTEFRVYKNIKSDFIREVAVKPPDHMKSNPAKVTVTIPVDEYTEKSFFIPIAIHSLPPDTQVRLFPQEAEISFSIGLKKFSEIIPDAFHVFVDWKDIESGLQFLPIYQDTVPDGLKSLQIKPPHVEYLIEKN